MSYTPVGWKDYPEKTTPTSAENLNKMEKGIIDAHEAIGDLDEIADIGDGTLAGAITEQNNAVIPETRGGTGKKTLNDSMNALINGLWTNDAYPKDNDFLPVQSAGGGDEAPIYRRTRMYALFGYIKNKLGGATLTDNLTIKKSSGLADFILESGARKGGLEVSAGTQSFGLWDFTNNDWVLVSHKDKSVSIPHGVSVASLNVNGKAVAVGDNSLLLRGTKSVTLTSYGGGQVLEQSLKVKVPSGYIPWAVTEVRFDYPQTWETIYLRLDDDGTITWHMRCNATGGGGTVSTTADVEVTFIKSTFISGVTI